MGLRGLLFNAEKPNQQWLDSGLLIYRIALAFALIRTHGIKKVIHFQETIEHIPDPFGLGGEVSTYLSVLANVICAVFVAVGCFTRASTALILSVTLSGFFFVHFNDPWPVKDVPLIYSIAFGFLLFMGPGAYSIDHSLNKQLNKE